jgi:hypothetical protein
MSRPPLHEVTARTSWLTNVKETPQHTASRILAKNKKQHACGDCSLTVDNITRQPYQNIPTHHQLHQTARLDVGLPSMSLLIQRPNNPIGDTNFGAPARRICKEQVGQQGILHFYACCVIALTQIHHNSTRKSQGHHPDIPMPGSKKGSHQGIIPSSRRKIIRGHPDMGSSRHSFKELPDIPTSGVKLKSLLVPHYPPRRWHVRNHPDPPVHHPLPRPPRRHQTSASGTGPSLPGTGKCHS